MTIISFHLNVLYSCMPTEVINLIDVDPQDFVDTPKLKILENTLA